jgi:hypothetical protein
MRPERAKAPEKPLRSARNGIAIRLANSGSPSGLGESRSTSIGVDAADAIGLARHCATRPKVFYCASRRGDRIGNPGAFCTNTEKR